MQTWCNLEGKPPSVWISYGRKQELRTNINVQRFFITAYILHSWKVIFFMGNWKRKTLQIYMQISYQPGEVKSKTFQGVIFDMWIRGTVIFLLFCCWFHAECRQVCHVKCVDFLPASCGLPTQFVWHYSQAMNDTPSKSPGASSARAAARSYDEDLTPSGWMKFPR